MQQHKGDTMLQKVLIGGLVTLALGVASCGSGESKPLTKAEFAQKANALCKQRNAAYAAVRTKGGELRQAVRLAFPTIRKFTDQFAGLKPPAELQAPYREILATERKLITVANQALAGRRVTAEDGPSLHRHERLRVELGMPACNS